VKQRATSETKNKGVKLGTLVKIQSGYSPSTFQLADNGEIPYIKVEDMNNCNKYQKSSRFYTNDVSRSVPQGAVIFPKRGAAIMNNKVRIAADRICMDTNMMALIPDKNKLDSEYLFNFLLQEKLFKIADTSTIPQINNKHIEPYIIPLPSLEDQKNIVSVITEWDQAIEKTEKLIAAKEKQMSWLRQCVLTSKYRIKGHTTDWKSVPLSELVEQRNETSQGKEEVFSVSVHKGLVNQIEHLGRSFSAKDTGHYNLVKPGDVVYTKSPTGDFPFGIVKQSTVEKTVIVSPLYGVYVPKSYDTGTFLDFFFESDVNARNYLRPLIQKGAKNTISITNDGFLKGKVKFPVDKKEIADIAALIRTAREEVHVLQETLKKYKEQKRGLMQKLLSGEWRIKTKEAA
jgi:type I restriction enzyme, S subunit